MLNNYYFKISKQINTNNWGKITCEKIESEKNNLKNVIAPIITVIQVTHFIFHFTFPMSIIIGKIASAF